MSSELNDPSLLKSAVYVDGRWIDKGGSGRRPLHNPSTGALLAELPQLTRAETAAAIEAAYRAQPDWRARSAKERSIILRRWFDLVVVNSDDLARLIVLE